MLTSTLQTERINIKQRQAEGIAAAKKRGVKFGRPIKEMPPNFGELITQWEKKELTMQEILKTYDMSESTFYHRMREYNAGKSKRK